MNNVVNKHGLSRDIPDPIKREVRQRCGFGCVFCGCAIIQYHHFDPEYVDADEHRTEGITLLCGTCHDRATKRIVGIDEIKAANQSPKSKTTGFTYDFLFNTRDKIHFQIGNAVFRRHAVVLYDDELLIGFAPPIEEGSPLRLFAHLEDDSGTHLLQIVDNVWVAGTHHFDVETIGNTLTIRKKMGELLLRLSLRGGEIVFDKLQMGFRGFKISVESDEFNVRSPNGGRMVVKCPNIYSTLRLLSTGSIKL